MLASVDLGPRLRENPEKLVSKTWPSDVQAELLTRAAVAPTSTSNATALTPTMTGAFLHALAPQSAASRLGDANKAGPWLVGEGQSVRASA
jgi:hypothetical protein